MVQPTRLLLQDMVLDVDARAFCVDFIRRHRLTITSVTLNSGALAPSCPQTQYLLSSLVDLPALVTLDLSGNALEHVVMGPLARLLAVPGRALTSLVLDDNAISDRGMSDLCGALLNNVALTHLSVSNNRLTRACCKSVAAMLRSNTTLRHLNLDVAVINGNILARGLQHNATLKRLDLNYCTIRDGGLDALVNALIANPKSALAHIGLWFVDMTDVGLISLMRLVRTSSTVDVLHVAGNQITDAGWAAVAATLRITSTLRVLGIAHGPLVSSGTSRLALQEAVRVNASVDMRLAEIDLFQPAPIPTVVEREAARAALLASGMCWPVRVVVVVNTTGSGVARACIECDDCGARLRTVLFEFFSCFCGSSSDSEFRAEVNQVRMNQGPRGSWSKGWQSRHGLRALFQCVDVLIVSVVLVCRMVV